MSSEPPLPIDAWQEAPRRVRADEWALLFMLVLWSALLFGVVWAAHRDDVKTFAYVAAAGAVYEFAFLALVGVYVLLRFLLGHPRPHRTLVHRANRIGWITVTLITLLVLAYTFGRSMAVAEWRLDAIRHSGAWRVAGIDAAAVAGVLAGLGVLEFAYSRVDRWRRHWQATHRARPATLGVG